MRYLKLLAFLIFIPFTASAQFFVTGDDPGRLRWNYMDTESYRVIYPQGSDSLARVYARKLEKYKVPAFLPSLPSQLSLHFMKSQKKKIFSTDIFALFLDVLVPVCLLQTFR